MDLAETDRKLDRGRLRRSVRGVLGALLLIGAGTCAARVRPANVRPVLSEPAGSHGMRAFGFSPACEDDSRYLLGAGIADVTPPLMGLGTGYNAPGELIEGLAMRLYSRAFVIESPCSARRVVFVSVDALHMYQGITMGVLEKLRSRYGDRYGAENVMLTATHAHGAPTNMSWRNLYSLFAGVSGFDELAYDLTVDGIVASIVRAHESRVPGTISIESGRVPDALHNRSRAAYTANADARAYGTDVDDTMTLLRLRGEDGGDIGLINWLGLHGTSLSIENHLLHGDNKGFASYYFEQSVEARERPFVAAFAQGVTGDVSPNTPDPRDPRARYLRPSDLDGRLDDLANARLHGLKQADVARSLFERAHERVGARLDHRHRYVDFEGLPVSPRYGGEPGARTCQAAVGAGIAAGTEEGSPSFIVKLFEGDVAFGKQLGKLALAPALQRCHGEKVVALPVGGAAESAWADTIVPLQIFTLGHVALVGSSFELTTMVARRLRERLLTTLAPMGIREVVIAEIANSYNMYVTTREEYALQHYEGTVTHFGPNTSAAYLEQVDALAAALVRGEPTKTGLVPPSLSRKLTLHTVDDTLGVLFDSAGAGAFGEVLEQPSARAKPGVVVARFQSAHPRSVADLTRARTLRTDGDAAFSFIEVQRLEAGAFRTVFTDAHPDTRIEFRRTGVLGLPLYEATVRWDARTAPAGTYRIVHHGVATRSLLGWLRSYLPFTGATRPFELEKSAGEVARGLD
jgi:neutral ceramidase